MIDAPEDWKMPESAPAPHKHPTSTPQVQDKINTVQRYGEFWLIPKN